MHSANSSILYFHIMILWKRDGKDNIFVLLQASDNTILAKNTHLVFDILGDIQNMSDVSKKVKK